LRILNSSAFAVLLALEQPSEMLAGAGDGAGDGAVSNEFGDAA
jgi:hypothetical protein